MIAAGVKRFIYGPGRFVGVEEHWEASSTMLHESGVEFRALDAEDSSK
jgi:hypothetical protein